MCENLCFLSSIFAAQINVPPKMSQQMPPQQMAPTQAPSINQPPQQPVQQSQQMPMPNVMMMRPPMQMPMPSFMPMPRKYFKIFGLRKIQPNGINFVLSN